MTEYYYIENSNFGIGTSTPDALLNIKGTSSQSENLLTIEQNDGTEKLTVTAAGVTTSTSLVATTADIDGGAIDGTIIGASSAAAGSFTTITASTSLDVTGSAGIILENDETITNSTNGTVLINGIVAAGTGSGAGVFQSNGDYDLTLQTGNSNTGNITITNGANGNIAITPNGTGEVDISKVDIDGGAIDGTVIGGSTPAAGTFAAIVGSSLSVSDGNITNVGSIACDSVVVDDASVGLDIVFGGATGTNKISLTDNLADALNITQAGNSYLKFVTTDENEMIKVFKGPVFESCDINLRQNSADSDPGHIAFNKSRHATAGSHTVVQKDDNIGKIEWYGSDGSDWIETASISVTVHKTPGSEDMPGKITFSTTSDGAKSTTKRMTISDDGVGIGTTSPGRKVHIDLGGSSEGLLLTSSASGTVDAFIGITSDNTAGKGFRINGYNLYHSTSGERKLIFQGTKDGDGTHDSNLMTITGDGYVGIGTTSPSYPLEVSGSAVTTSGSGYYFNTGGGLHAFSGSLNVNLKVNGIIWATDAVAAASDSRIKKEISEITDDEALTKIRLLKPSRYQYIDDKSRGTDYVYGFIAQEVKEVLPYAVGISTEFIPNVYQGGTVENNIITLPQSHGLTEGGTLQIMTSIKLNKIEATFTVLDDNRLTIESPTLSDDSLYDENGELLDYNIFVYGTQVEDFHTLKKDAIWSVAVSALQEVDRQLQAEKAKTATLETDLTAEKAKTATLETQMADLLARVTALENP